MLSTERIGILSAHTPINYFSNPITWGHRYRSM